MKELRIVGGGLAGLTLGLALRRQGAPVCILEAGRYPRHRVCGEFVSGRGRDVLRELGLEEKLLARGACEARTAAFHTPYRAGALWLLPQPALCLTRYAMDDCLAHEFRRRGGELVENERWQGEFGPATIRATGRRPASSRKGWRWFGLKAHARGVALAADLEVHVFDSGYVGLCRLGDGLVNVCGLFRRRAATPGLARQWREFLAGAPGTMLHRRMAGAEFVEESFCSTAALDLTPRRAAARSDCCLGDAITMIAPLTGNGMSMAFESARLACEPLLAHSRNGLAWGEAVARANHACDRAFRRRLLWSARLQQAAFSRPGRDAVAWAGGAWPALWRQLFLRTR